MTWMNWARALPGGLLLLVLFAPLATAQFIGGDGDGFATDTTVFNRSVIVPGPSPLFTGGDGDGFSTDTTVFGRTPIPFVASAHWQGGVGDGAGSDTTRWSCGKATLLVDARVFLEGPYSAGLNQPAANFLDAVPNLQPYSGTAFLGTDLAYQGVEYFSVRPDSVVEWVRLNLRSSVTPEDVVSSPVVGFLKIDGTITDVDAISPVPFQCIDPGHYYLVVDHRNHLDVMSAVPLDLTTGQGSWDFTNDVNAAFSDGGTPMKTLEGDRYGMVACDISFDGQITATDFNAWLTATKAAANGYRLEDCDMDGQVTASDFNLWLTNTKAAYFSQVP